MALELVPINLADANAFVKAHHRHHKPVVGAKFCVSVQNGEGICGVAIAGRPVARALDDGRTLEVTRVATDGARNACSMLYGAILRAAKALGYRRVVTYTLANESGSSLKACGWKESARVRGRSWSCPSRPREDHTEAQMVDKVRWEAVF